VSRAATDGIYALAADKGAGGAREELQSGRVRPSLKEGCDLPLRLAAVSLAPPRALRHQRGARIQPPSPEARQGAAGGGAVGDEDMTPVHTTMIGAWNGVEEVQ
jgi:hypothetical protein